MTTAPQGHPAEIHPAYWWGYVETPEGSKLGVWKGRWEKDTGDGMAFANDYTDTWRDFMPPEGVLLPGAGKVTVVPGEGDPLWWTVVGFNFNHPATPRIEYGCLIVRGQYDYAEATRIGFAALPWLPAYIGDAHEWDNTWFETCPCCVDEQESD